jgi:hypothetical protein
MNSRAFIATEQVLDRDVVLLGLDSLTGRPMAHG